MSMSMEVLRAAEMLRIEDAPLAWASYHMRSELFSRQLRGLTSMTFGADSMRASL
jgi:hypothetical protein